MKIKILPTLPTHPTLPTLNSTKILIHPIENRYRAYWGEQEINDRRLEVMKAPQTNPSNQLLRRECQET